MKKKMRSKNNKRKILVLGIGNVLMGDEGVGVHVVNSLANAALPPDVECMDGGTGSFQLLEPMQNAGRVILIDASVDGREIGSIRRLRPRFSTDYPRTLTAHDIGLKDLLDAFYLMGRTPDVTLFAVSIPPLRDMRLELSEKISSVIPKVSEMVMREAAGAAN